MTEEERSFFTSNKKISPKQLSIICFYLYFVPFLGFLFFSLSFLPTYEIASIDLENQTFTMIQIAFGTMHFTLNGLVLSALITSVIASCLMLAVAIFCTKLRSFSPFNALFISLSFLLYSYTLVIFLLNPLLASYTLSVFDSFSSLWTIYVMSLLLVFIVMTSLGLLIYLSVVHYQTLNLEK